ERSQLLDLAAVGPGPVQVDGRVDVELAAQPRDAVLVDLDDLEVAHPAAVVREDLLHHHLSPFTSRPKRSRSRSSRLRRRTSAGSKPSLPRTSMPNSPDANGNTISPTVFRRKCGTLTLRNSPALVPSRSSEPTLPNMLSIARCASSSSGRSPARSSSSK